MARLGYALAAFPLALFFVFVGGNKAVAPLAQLAAHHAWTIWLPAWLGRIVGVSELLCAAALLVGFRSQWRMWGRVAGVALVLNQIIAALVHLAHAETSALPQNGVLVVMALVAAVLARK